MLQLTLFQFMQRASKAKKNAILPLGRPMKIESQDTNIEALLTSSFLIIPRFQRPYSWDDENLEDFWKDITQIDGADYFIGSMVIYKNGRQQFGVVDGQQRLTTITILLCVIRDKFAELEADGLARGLHALIERADRDSVNKYVLKTETSYPFFQEEIQKFGDADFKTQPQREEARLKSAYNFFLSKVSDLLRSVDIDTTVSADSKVPKKIEKLKLLRDSVLFLNLIRIELDNEDDAYLIFETLNTRGKDLALSDLLKNQFTKLIKNKGDIDTVREQWARMLENLNGSPIEIDTDLFFTHSWSSRFDATTQQKAYKNIKEALTTDNAKGQLAEFVQDSQYYRAIFDPTYSWRKEERVVQQSLAALRLFRVTQQTPGVLSLIRSYSTGSINLKSLKRALTAIENFHFLFTAVTSSRSSGGISAMYSSFGRRLYDAENPNEAGIVINDLIGKLKEKTPSGSEVFAGFEQIRYTTTNSKQTNLVRYILQKFAKADHLAFSEDASDLTIEHVYPQAKIGGDWTEDVVGSIGNLILLTGPQNVSLGNNDFSEKLPHFKQWASTVPQEVQTQTEWTVDFVKQRTALMAERALNEVWRIS